MRGLAAVVAIAGSLMISSTAPALLEGASDRAADIHGDVNPAEDGYGALLPGDRSAEVFASAGYAIPTEADPLAGRRGCDLSSGIDTTAPLAADSAPASGPAQSAREGICFGPHDVIEYYELRGNADPCSVDSDYAGVPSAVRSRIADTQLFQDRLSVSRESPAKASRQRNVSTLAKVPAAATRRAHEAPALRLAGCSRCVGQAAQSSPGRAKPFAIVLAMDLFRNARSVRREHLQSGVARQREAPRLAAWNPRRGWWSASLRHLKEDNS